MKKLKKYVVAMAFEEDLKEGPDVYLVEAKDEDEALIHVYKEKKDFTDDEIKYLMGVADRDENMGETDDQDFEINYDFLDKIFTKVICLDEQKFDKA